MKFIGSINNVKLKDKEINVRLEHFHRTVTGSLSNTSLFLFPRKYEYSNNETREIIISQYPPHSWGNIYRLKFKVIDKPGITEKITKILVENDININTQESEMTRSSSFFTVSMVADFSEYLKIEGNIKFETIEEKRNFLEKRFREIYQKEFNEKLERFSLKRVNFLNYNSKEFRRTEDNSIEKNILNEYYDNKTNSLVKVVEKKITIEKKILDDLDVYKKINTKRISYTINSDTEEKYLLLRFFNTNQCVIQFDLSHENVKGAINKFSKAIIETDENFNIINSYNRIENFNNKAHWIVMIDCTNNPDNWHILLQKFKQINKVKEVKIVSYTNALKDLSKHPLPKIKIKKKKNKLKNLIDKNKDLNKTIDDISVNFNKYLKFVIGVIFVFFITIITFLYYAFSPELDANSIINPIAFISTIAGAIGVITLILQSNNFFKKLLKLKN